MYNWPLVKLQKDFSVKASLSATEALTPPPALLTLRAPQTRWPLLRWLIPGASAGVCVHITKTIYPTWTLYSRKNYSIFVLSVSQAFSLDHTGKIK